MRARHHRAIRRFGTGAGFWTARRRAEQELRAIAADEAEGHYELAIEEADDPREAILRRTSC